MKTPITYYGGKQSLATTILGMMPAHKIYCEPFFGGGVFWAKGKSYLEVINDRNDRLMTFYWACQHELLFPMLMDKVQHTLCSESTWRRAKRIYDDPECQVKYSQVDIAWAVWVVTNLSYAATPSGGWKWCNGTAGSHSGILVHNKRDEFSKRIHDRLADVQISCREALDVIKERDSEDTFFYLEPPYPGAEQKHYHGYKFADLEQLLQLLATIKGRFILSNYMSPTLKQHIKQNGWLYESRTMQLRTTNFHNHKEFAGPRKKTEILVYNYVIEPDLFME